MKIIIKLSIILGVVVLNAQEISYHFNPLVVTANRYPTHLVNIAKNITVIDAKEIEQMPVTNVQGLLSFVNGVDLQQRGPLGVQAEVGIRGGTFQETLVMIDGMSINNPQTAHHNFDVPVSLESIDHIEIVRGQASGVYGANALAGVINIITKNSQDGFSAGLTGGQYGLLQAEIQGAKNMARVQNSITMSMSQSDGFMENTDFENRQVSTKSLLNVGESSVSLNTGYVDKKFGAYSFYSTAFPNEWEHTTFGYVNALAEIQHKNLSISPKIYWQNHFDDFVLERSDPSFYRNKHTTDVTGAELGGRFLLNKFATSVVIDFRNEKLTSTNLGDHSRQFGGLYSATSFPVLNALVNLAGHASYFDKWGWKVWPNVDAQYWFNSSLKIYANAGASYRMPTFTEMFYNSPANIGDEHLKYSQAVSFETGLNYQTNSYSAIFSLYQRHNKNSIDWTRLTKDEPWQVSNLAEINTRGIDTQFNWITSSVFITKISVGYSHLWAEKNTTKFESKYVLNYLRNQASLTLFHKLPLNMDAAWAVQFKDRMHGDQYSVINCSVSRQIKQGRIILQANNLFNTDYYEVVGVPMPGRWLTAGFSYNFGK